MPSGILSNLSFGIGFKRVLITRNSPVLLSNTKTKFPLARSFGRNLMAISGPKTVLGDIYMEDLISPPANGFGFSKTFFADRSRSSCKNVYVKMRNKEFPKSHLVCGYHVFDVMQMSSNLCNFVGGRMLKNFSTLSVSFSARPANDVPLNGNSCREQDSTVLSNRTLKLQSGSCYLPHPDKEETGGEDAHFICEDEQVIGVADGVGGWADVGINAGLFSRELMSNSVKAIQEEPKGSVDPGRVLEKAHSCTTARGSSTACIIALTSEGIHAINLGDSGFMVVRDGCTIFQSPVQQHGFNFTYQLESGNEGDLPSSGQVFTIPVAPGDVIIVGTDGLFDNLYNKEVTAVIVQSARAGLGPQATAQKIATLARQRAQDRNRQTPFSTAAQDAGFRYYGGKLDDITVVVSYITN